MALINCAECGKQVSDLAACCPHCGAPVQNVATRCLNRHRCAPIAVVHAHNLLRLLHWIRQQKKVRNPCLCPDCLMSVAVAGAAA